VVLLSSVRDKSLVEQVEMEEMDNYIERLCLNCGYEWFEAPLDQGKDTSSGTP